MISPIPALFCALVAGFGVAATAMAAPQTFNTALPVAQDEFVFREQFVYRKATDDPSPADRKLQVLGGVSVLGYGVTGEVAVFGVLPYLDKELDVTTPWLEIDDVFYEARGTAWALIEFLQAVEVDFADVLRKKNAQVSLQQIIRELEGTQETVWSPMVLNGSGFGLLANHSLVMASYISRANAAIIDLRDLLSQG